MLEKAVLYKIRIGKITLAAWAAQVVVVGVFHLSATGRYIDLYRESRPVCDFRRDERETKLTW